MSGHLIRRDPFAWMDEVLAAPFTTPMFTSGGPARRVAHLFTDARVTGLRGRLDRDGEDLLVHLDVPGVDPATGIEIMVADQTLTVRTTRTVGDTQTSSAYQVDLPRAPEPGQVSAHTEHGALTVRVRGAYREPDGLTGFAVPVTVGPAPATATLTAAPDAAEEKAAPTAQESTPKRSRRR